MSNTVAQFEIKEAVTEQRLLTWDKVLPQRLA